MLFGVIVGSFLTVCIFRLPIGRVEDDEELEGAEGEPADSKPEKTSVPKGHEHAVSFNNPQRSICPSCGKQLLWWHNIPLVSWILLRGKCAFCKTRIPARYPLVELTTGLIALWCFQRFDDPPTAFLVFLFSCALLVITLIDYDFYIIPNVITLPGTVIGLGVAAFNQYTQIFHFPVVTSLADSFWGILAGAGFLFVVAEAYYYLRNIEGLGMGDVKLLAMTGAFFGPICSIYTIFMGSLVGSVIGIALVVVSGRRMTQALPFGPYLALGTFLFLFTGDELAQSMADSVRMFLSLMEY